MSWISRASWRRASLIAALAVLLSAILIRSAISASSSTPPDWLVKEAEAVLSRSAPTGTVAAFWALTDAKTANPVVDPATGVDDVPARQEYIVVLKGQFTYEAARVPPGASLPTGTMIVFTVNPATQVISDLSVYGADVDLSSIPDLTPLDLSSQ